MKKIVIVSDKDEVIGAEELIVALRKQHIRRIARIFVFNQKGELFLQRRPKGKLIAPNKWDQSVGGHVDEGETYEIAAKRELKEELGIENVNLLEVAKFYLEEPYLNLKAKQFNTLYKIIFNGNIKINEKELAGGKWFKLSELERLLKEEPDEFAPGLKKSFEEYKKSII